MVYVLIYRDFLFILHISRIHVHPFLHMYYTMQYIHMCIYILLCLHSHLYIYIPYVCTILLTLSFPSSFFFLYLTQKITEGIYLLVSNRIFMDCNLFDTNLLKRSILFIYWNFLQSIQRGICAINHSIPK